MSVESSSGRFSVRWRENGSNKRKSFPTQQEAEEFDRSNAARLYRHALVGRINSASLPVEIHAANWLASLSVAPITKYGYERSIFKPFCEYFQGRYIQNLNNIDLNAYFNMRKGLVMPSTVHKEYQIIKYFFSCMTDVLLLPVDPMRKVKVDYVAHSPGIALSYRQERDLLAAATDYQRSKILLGLDTGIRAKNLGMIYRREIDFGERTLLFHVLKKRVRRYVHAETRTVPLTTRLYESLLKFQDLSEDELLFTYAGQPLQDPDKFLKKMRPKLGFYFRWHDLRHTFYTKLLEACDNTALAEWCLGHSVTYWHPRLEKLQQAFLAMELRTEDAIEELSRKEVEA